MPSDKKPYGYYSQIYNDDKPKIASEFSGFYAEWAWEIGQERFPKNLFEEKLNKNTYLKHEICKLLNHISESVDFDKSPYSEEIQNLRKVRPHAVITTNYDNTLERLFENYQSIVG